MDSIHFAENELSKVEENEKNIDEDLDAPNIAKDNSNKTMHLFKVILIGDIAVGKTCLLSRYVNNKFNPEYMCTLGVEYKVKSVSLDSKTAAELKIWDTCGEEKFRSITRQYFRDSQGVLILFDLTAKATFDHLEKWIEEVKNGAPKDVIIIIVGNKSDLEDERQVDKKDINILCEKNKVKYLEVSAKTGSNVVLLFETLANMMIKKEIETDDNTNNEGHFVYKRVRGKKLNSKKNKKGGCC